MHCNLMYFVKAECVKNVHSVSRAAWSGAKVSIIRFVFDRQCPTQEVSAWKAPRRKSTFYLILQIVLYDLIFTSKKLFLKQ